MSKYLTGHQVIATLNIEAFELVAFAKKGALQPYTRSGKPVRDIQEEQILRDSEEHRLDTLLMKRGEFEAGIVMTSSGVYISRVERERKRAELEAKIAKLEGKGIMPMSYQQIKEKLSQHSPCVWESFDLPKDEIKSFELIRKFQGFLYSESDVKKLTEIEPVNDIHISQDSMSWDNITVTVISDVELHIQWPNSNVTRSYELLGFKDGRTGNPITAWAILLEAAKKDGQIPWTFKTRKKVEKHAQTLRKKFKVLFPEVPGEPVPIKSASQVYEFSFHLKPQIE